MDKLIDAAFGVHPQALLVGAKRLELLASNMANADTPGFKARDIDFRTTLESVVASGDAPALRTTHAAHVGGADSAAAAEPLYRVPNHPALDGNTVDTQLEQASFAEASVRYQASIDFLDARVSGLRKALRGE